MIHFGQEAARSDPGGSCASLRGRPELSDADRPPYPPMYDISMRLRAGPFRPDAVNSARCSE